MYQDEGPGLLRGSGSRLGPSGGRPGSVGFADTEGTGSEATLPELGAPVEPRSIVDEGVDPEWLTRLIVIDHYPEASVRGDDLAACAGQIDCTPLLGASTLNAVSDHYGRIVVLHAMAR